MVSRPVWKVVDVVGLLLEPHERDAVRGDFAERGTLPLRALTDITGLSLRRQIAWWSDWRPWLALWSIAFPLGVLLSVLSRSWADGAALYGWLYTEWWSSAFLTNSTARHDFLVTLIHFSGLAGALATWSWTCGFALGSLSRRTVWVTGTIFCLVVLTATLRTTTTARINDGNAVAFSSIFGHVLSPFLVRWWLVVCPTVGGIVAGVNRLVRPTRSTLRWALATVGLTIVSSVNVRGALVFGWVPVGRSLGLLRDSHTLIALPAVVLLWPTAYLLGATWYQLSQVGPIVHPTGR